MKKDLNGWYLAMAYLVATSSKDRKTKYGAVIVGPYGEIRSTGHNGFPRGCDDYAESRHQRPEKYFWTEHAERNAIYNAARVGTPLDGCTLYVQGCPCADCARAIIQSGIAKVVVHKDWEDRTPPKWQEHADRSKAMFEETGVEYVIWDGEVSKMVAFHNGEEICL